MNKVIIFILGILVTGCFDGIKDTIKNTNAADKQDIMYYADKTVSSLEVPPDLTKPTQNNALKLDKFINKDKNLITFNNKDVRPIKKSKNKDKNIGINVQKSGDRRWLIIKKDVDYVWRETQKFLKDNGFKIVKSNKRIGIFETNYLENRAVIPNKQLGVIRALLKKATKENYALPTIDKYRVRLEVIDDGTTELYLSLTSMREVVTLEGDSENTIWQQKPTDKATEVEMLYRLMLYLGDENSAAKTKIQTATTQNQVKVELQEGLGGYAKLQFQLNKVETWNAIAFALDELNINITDKDKQDASFYINNDNNSQKGILVSIFGSGLDDKTFQIKVKSLSAKVSEVYFLNLSKEEHKKVKTFSNELFNNIVQQFK